MKEELNPYEPPRVGSMALPAGEGEACDWRIEGDFLLVRDGAVLPAVCLWSGVNGCPGSWIRLPVPTLSGSFRLSPAIRVTAYQSRSAVLKRFVRIFGGTLLGFVSGSASSVIMIGDGSATPFSIVVSFLLIGLGLLVAFSGHRTTLREVGDGWYRLDGLAPGAIAGFKGFRGSADVCR